MVQPTQDQTHHHSQMLWNPVPVHLKRNGQVRGRLWDAWPQSHVRTTLIIMWHPLVQETLQVVLGEREQKIQAFPPERTQEPLTEGISLGTSHWGFEYPQPQVACTLVELLGENCIAVMDQEAVYVVRWHRFAQLL